jgi:hypothetical protein
MTTIPLLSGKWVYKFNICGLRDDFQEIWVKLKESNSTTAHQLLIWISIILNFFNVHLPFD